jgi:DNA-binding transcriptional ArsR family regulator
MKEFWIGVLRGIGTLCAVTLGSWLIARIPAVKEWVTPRILPLGAPERASLTIFLGVSSLALLGLWIWTRLSLSKLRSRKHEPAKITLPQEQVEILRHLSAANGAYFAPMCKALGISHQRLTFHLEALARLHMVEGRSGGPYNVKHEGRRHLNDRGLL